MSLAERLMPALRCLDAETAHGLAIAGLRMGDGSAGAGVGSSGAGIPGLGYGFR